MIMNKNVLNSFVLKRRASFGLYVFLLATVHLRSAEPLLTAVRQGDLAAVQKLVSEGAPRHARDAEGNTALMLATLYAGAGMVDYLLQGGADVNATNSWGGTALMRGSYNAEMIRLLIQHGGNVNLRSQLGNTALMLAARVNGNSKGVKLLLEQGANVNATNSLGADALMCAAASDDEENVRLLLDRGANLNRGPALSEGGTIWGGGRTPLMEPGLWRGGRFPSSPRCAAVIRITAMAGFLRRVRVGRPWRYRSP